MGLKSQIVKFINNYLPDNSINKQDGIVNFGDKNLLPNEILQVIASSGTATSCISKIKSFIEADGFTNDAENLLQVNKYQNAKQLLAEISYSVSLFNGFALHILYRLDGTIGSVEMLPFETIRITENRDIIYNKNLGKRDFKKGENVEYEKFKILSPEKRLKKIEEDVENFGTQKGEVLYSYINNPYSKFYPHPEFISALNDIKSDGALSDLEYRNIARGFRPNVIISTVGEIDDKQVDDSTGLTDADIFDNNLKAFTGEDAATILHLQSDTKDGLPSITQFPLADLLDGVDRATDRVARKVCRLLNVPPVLIGLSMPEGLGNTQAISNSIKLFNACLISKQNLISESFKKLFPQFGWNITTLNLIDYIPIEILNVLTNDEKRALGGYEPLPLLGTSVDSLNSVISVLSNVALTEGQKIQTLIILFGLQEIEAKKLVTGGENVN